MRRIVAVAALGAAAVVSLVWGVQRKLIYFPTQDVPAATLIDADIEEVSFPTADGLTLDAWMVPPSIEPNGTTIVVFHGNGGNRADRYPLASGFAQLGYAVLLVDYRGYGGNPGDPSESGLSEDARAALAYVTSRPDVDPMRLVYFGESLGAAVAVAAASESPPVAVVLRSPFTSLSDVASVHYPYLPTGLLLRDSWASIGLIGSLEVPLLVIAGTADTIVPYDQSERLFHAAAGPKRLVTFDGADHNDLELTSGPRLIAETAAFLDEHLAAGP